MLGKLLRSPLRQITARAAVATTAAGSAAFFFGAQSDCEGKKLSLKLVDDKTTPLDLEIQQRFLALDQGERVQAEYVWIGGNNELRCKTKTLERSPLSIKELPVWNFDGSSTEQAPGSDSEVLLVPCAIYKDPFRAGPSGSSKNIIVLCDCYKPDKDAPGGVGAPIPTNTRVGCKDRKSVV